MGHLDAEASREFRISPGFALKGRDLLLSRPLQPGDETPDI